MFIFLPQQQVMTCSFSSHSNKFMTCSFSSHSTAPVADAWTLPITLPTFRTACQRAVKRRRWWIVLCLLFAVCFIGNQLHKVLPWNQFLFCFVCFSWRKEKQPGLLSICMSWLSFCTYHTGVCSCIPEETKKVCMWKCLFLLKLCTHKKL